jgi:hypothetical protein
MTSLGKQLSTATRQSRRLGCQRTQAAMLSVALAISATLPAGGVALARETDQEREGAAAPEPTPPDSTADPDFDPGGDTPLPFDLGAPTDGGDDDSGDGAPVDTEPVSDPDALDVLLDDPTAAPDALDGTDNPGAPAETPPTQLPAPTPTPVSPPPAATSPQVDTDTEKPASTEQRSSGRGKADTTRKRTRDRVRKRPAIRVTIPAAAVRPVAVPAVPVATTAAESVQAAATEPSTRARSGQRTYTVQPDDHLWKIASDLLGPGATNSEIVAESNRLYRLNRDRIGDDPNVLIAGTVLRLR